MPSSRLEDSRPADTTNHINNLTTDKHRNSKTKRNKPEVSVNHTTKDKNTGHKQQRITREHKTDKKRRSVPGRTGRAPVSEASVELPPATGFCAGSNGGLSDRQAPGGVDTPG